MISDVMYCTKCGKSATKEVKRCACGNTYFSNIKSKGIPIKEPDTLLGAWDKYIKGGNRNESCKR